MFTALARLCTRRPRTVVALSVAAVIAAFAGGSSVADHLVPYNSDNPRSENVRARQLVERSGGFNPVAGMVAVVDTPAGVRAETSRRRVRAVQRAMEREPETARVNTFYTSGSSALVARDRRSMAVVANFAPVPEKARQDSAERVMDRLAGQPGVRLGGYDVAQVELNETAAKDLERAELIVFPILFLLALWFFRGFVAALTPPLVGIATVAMTFGLLRALSEATSVSLFALNLVTGLGLGLAIDYSLFVVSRYREERARGVTDAVALERTVATAGRTVLFSAITVAGALAALMLFPENFLRSMGLAGAMVPLIACAAALVLLPAVLMLLGPRIDALAPRWLARRAESDARATDSSRWARWSRLVMRRPVVIALVTGMTLLLMGLPALDTKFILADARVLPSDAGSRQVFDTLAGFPANPGSAIFVASEPIERPEARALTRRLTRLPGVSSVQGPERLRDGGVLISVVPRGDPLSRDTQDLVRRIRGIEAPADFAVGGESARFVDQKASLGDRAPYALGIVLLVTLVVIFAMTGSVLLPVKSFAMNFLTLAASFGLLVLVFQEGRLEGLLDYVSPGALDSTQPILMCAVVFGLSTDYGVFLLSRIKEARDNGASNRDAVAIGLERTGRIVTAAALMFCVAIGAFATSQIVFIKEVGVGTAAAVLIDATLIRALLVPALMELFGGWNWWAPSPLRRIHERFGLSEHGAAAGHPAPEASARVG